MSWEKYFYENRGYVSLAYFYKDLRTYVYDQQGTFDVRPGDAAGLYRPAAGSGRRVQPPGQRRGRQRQGLEFAVSVPFDMFADWLEGFGIIGNYSDTSSSIKRLGPDGPDEPIAGLLGRGLQPHVLLRGPRLPGPHQPALAFEFLGEIQGFGADRALVYIDGEDVVDAQRVTAQSGALDGLPVVPGQQPGPTSRTASSSTTTGSPSAMRNTAASTCSA